MTLLRKRRVGVALRDGSKFGMASGIFVVFCSRASFRDAIPMALRLPRRYAPRNDTESGAFFVWKRMFCAICGHFLRGIASHRVSNVSFRKSFRFPAKPTDFVIARRTFSMPDAASFNRTRRQPGTNYAGGKAAVGCIPISRKNRRSDGTAVILEVPPRFELGSQGFADPCLTTWPRHRI